ncbi:deoxyguanosinetriphosphate triphosphohydrolase [Methylophilaceae bacterium]|nr:deoxyguanosinetriphosphate triphosphohydrolase [Methylophilaceae bacterium]
MKKYAVSEKNSLGREHLENKSPLRNDFQRDRDRIIHSSAFRRLMYKTQVFVNHEGDMFRTRLTHSLEVSQISRGIARSLELNEDLSETIALAHDLGHTPFGHAGQDALNKCMKDHGGFEHNFQSLRVVDKLEKRYSNFSGLNLTFESREGILKHCSKKNASLLGGIGERFLNKTHPSLEAQIVDIADSIAYNIHDLEDGYRSGILPIAKLNQLDFFAENFSKSRKNLVTNEIDEKIRVYETLRYMMFTLINDVTSHSKKLIRESNIKTIDEIRNYKTTLINLSEPVQNYINECRVFLRSNLYEHPRVNKMSRNAQKIIINLFNYYDNNFDALPNDYIVHDKKYRSIADFLSGMTDRFADDIYKSLN